MGLELGYCTVWGVLRHLACFSCINCDLTDILSGCINITEQMRKMPQNGSCTPLLITHYYYLSSKTY